MCSVEILVSQTQTLQINTLEGLQELLYSLNIENLSVKSTGSNLVIDASAPNTRIHMVVKGEGPQAPALDQLIAMLLLDKINEVNETRPG